MNAFSTLKMVMVTLSPAATTEPFTFALFWLANDKIRNNVQSAFTHLQMPLRILVGMQYETAEFWVRAVLQQVYGPALSLRFLAPIALPNWVKCSHFQMVAMLD